MKALIDGDILRYECGFAGEAAIKARSQGATEVPQWDWIENILFERFNRILNETGSDSYTIYLTEQPSFRYEVAKTRPYKGQRVGYRPWHFRNLSAFIKNHFECVVARPGLEADDEIAIDHMKNEYTVVCSRDKDLRQLPGLSYSWELGKQPRWGPHLIADPGHIYLSEDRKALSGEGILWFYGQLLVGDRADNVPGLEGCGPVKAYGLLKRADDEQNAKRAWDVVVEEYVKRYKHKWKERLTEQGRLLWLVRSYPYTLWEV